MTRVLFRVDATPQLGLGHLQRCLSLALALRRHRAQCVFLLADPNVVAVDRIANEGFAVETVAHRKPWSHGEARQLAARARASGVDVIVVDCRLKDARYVEALGASGCSVATVEDRRVVCRGADIVINAMWNRVPSGPRTRAGGQTLLTGPRYALLRPEYRRPRRRRLKACPRNILVTLGGSDPLGLIPTLLTRLEQLREDVAITAVVGPYGDEPALRATGSHCQRIELVRKVTRLRPLLLRADIAISGAGQTLYEMAATGTPTVALTVARDQSQQLRMLAHAGVVRSAGDATSRHAVDRVVRELSGLLHSEGLRRTLARRGQRLVDGKGAARAAVALLRAHAAAANHR